MTRSNLTSSNDSFLAFNFTKVEETPLMDSFKAGVLTLLGVVILSVGLLIQVRIYIMLRQQQSDRTVAAIDRLFKTNNLINILFQPTFLVYLMASYHLYPMVDYIGLYGCVFLSHFIQVYTALYCLVFPLTIAIVRFLFVVFSLRVKAIGTSLLINIVLALSILVPLFMTLSLQYPVSDFIHGAFNNCRGRFEVFFNPTHPDPITPGKLIGCSW